MLQTGIKLAISLTIILVCTHIGRKLPSLAGLIAVMPLTGMLVMVFLHFESGADPGVMMKYSKGAFFGILPSILFFVAALICFKKHAPIGLVLSAGFAAWLMGAFVHQWLLK